LIAQGFRWYGSADGATLRRLLVWHEFLDQRKELSLLKPDVASSSSLAASNAPRSTMPAATAISSLRANSPARPDQATSCVETAWAD
jgi:hypothetical protein